MNNKNHWMQTFTGRRFFPLDPDPDLVCIEDIAHALSLIARFGGHSAFHYSVAQHSLWCSEHCPEEPLLALLHDSTEAYIGDMVRPLKVSMPEFHVVEERLWKAICTHFGLNPELPPIIKAIDNLALITERRDIWCFPPVAPWAEELERITPHPTRLTNLDASPKFHKRQFLTRFDELYEKTV